MNLIKPNLDDPSHITQIHSILASKASLRLLYEENYLKIKSALSTCPGSGSILELGSGGGFFKKYVPEVITSDILGYPDLDVTLDATALPFKDLSLKAIFMLNVLHHIRDVPAFFQDANRVLVSGGRIFIVDPYPGVLSKPIYRYLHQEPFHPEALEWQLPIGGGPLSQANSALAWIVFIRDRLIFEKRFPNLRISSLTPSTPIRYWLIGGLKRWYLLPKFAFGMATKLDQLLLKISSECASFLEIQLVKE